MLGKELKIDYVNHDICGDMDREIFMALSVYKRTLACGNNRPFSTAQMPDGSNFGDHPLLQDGSSSSQGKGNQTAGPAASAEGRTTSVA